MEEERRRLEEVMVALALGFTGADANRMRDAVRERVRELDPKNECLRGPVWNGRLPVTQENVGSNPIGGAAGVV